jgi:ADP-heptose:LPS heptosyltransferase
MLARILRTAERLVRRQHVHPEKARQILVLEYRLPLGCVVHMTPAFEAMKHAESPERRDLNITVATCGLGLQVLRHSPFVDRLIETPDPTKDLRAAVHSLRKQLRLHGIRPDCVLTGASDQRTTIALLGLLGSSGWRGGFTLRPNLFHRPLEYDTTLSLIRNNLRVAKLLGRNAEPTQPRVFFSPDDAAIARSLLQAANPDGRRVVVFVTQTSGGQPKNWPLDRFIQVIRHAALIRGCAIVYVGTAADAPAIETLRIAAGGIGTSVAGKTSVSQLAALLAQCDAAVTLDTGTMHVGRAVGLPMAILGPCWDPPLEWMPLGVENVRILRGPDCPQTPENYQLDEIPTASVIAALDELMWLYPTDANLQRTRLHASLSTIDHLAH